MKKVGILGSGVVGQALAEGFIKHGYEVMISSRNMNKLHELKKTIDFKGELGSFEDAAKFGDIIVLAAKGSAAKDMLDLAGKQYLNGKTVIDVTNPIDDNAKPHMGVIKFYKTDQDSLMEQLQAYVPEANFVKAFNHVGYSLMVNPEFDCIKPSMFICGNSDAAKSEVKEILEKFGWEPEDMGMANSASVIENLCILWLIPAFTHNSWTHAFKLLKK
jgi:predicted dinucleotide-binding enzyme